MQNAIHGVGLGFRRDLTDYFLNPETSAPQFVELAPENWMEIGGKWAKALKAVAERFPVTSHGLSLSLGSPEPLDLEFLGKIKNFLKNYDIQLYSEHLSFCKCGNAHLYDLLPIPFCSDAVRHVADRIKVVQDFLGRRIAIENVSYYSPIAPEMDEATFIRSVLEEADCDLLLDVNNVYVNSFNHGYEAKKFILDLPLDRVVYIHMAGHEQVASDLIIDTHGQPIVEPVFELFQWSLGRLKPAPVLLERDFNFSSFSAIESELIRLRKIVDGNWKFQNAA